MLVGPKSVKQHCLLDCLFLHIRDLRVKAARRTLMKLTLCRQKVGYTSVIFFAVFAHLQIVERKKSFPARQIECHVSQVFIRAEKEEKKLFSRVASSQFHQR